MQRPSLRLLLSLSTLAFAGSASTTAAETQTVASFKKTVTKTVEYKYLLSLPTGYDAAADKKWPVILFLHGSGERGTDPWLVAKHGPPMLIRGESASTQPADGKSPPAPGQPPETLEAKAQRERAAAALRDRFIVVSPQCPSGPWWDDDGVIGLLDDIMAKHKTDPARVYLTGLSMGGYGTWSVGLKYPERFAAIVPICGGGSFRDLLSASRAKRDAVAALGIRVFHGAKDPTVPLTESENMVTALKKLGVKDLSLTVYPEAKHDSWTETYNNPELYEWLLKHQRPPAANAVR
jgi:predicted peptidase